MHLSCCVSWYEHNASSCFKLLLPPLPVILYHTSNCDLGGRNLFSIKWHSSVSFIRESKAKGSSSTLPKVLSSAVLMDSECSWQNWIVNFVINGSLLSPENWHLPLHLSVRACHLRVHREPNLLFCSVDVEHLWMTVLFPELLLSKTEGSLTLSFLLIESWGMWGLL